MFIKLCLWFLTILIFFFLPIKTAQIPLLSCPIWRLKNLYRQGEYNLLFLSAQMIKNYVIALNQ